MSRVQPGGGEVAVVAHHPVQGFRGLLVEQQLDEILAGEALGGPQGRPVRFHGALAPEATSGAAA